MVVFLNNILHSKINHSFLKKYCSFLKMITRTFRVICIVLNQKPIIIRDKNNYKSKYGPGNAASKAWTRYCNQLKLGKNCKGEIYIQDITKNAKQWKNIYGYSVVRTKSRKGSFKRGRNGVVRFKYQNKIKSLNL